MRNNLEMQPGMAVSFHCNTDLWVPRAWVGTPFWSGPDPVLTALVKPLYITHANASLEYEGLFCRQVWITLTEMSVLMEADSELSSWHTEEEAFGSRTHLEHSMHSLTQPNIWAPGGHPPPKTTRLEPHVLNPIPSGAIQPRQMWAGIPSGKHCNLRWTNASDFSKRASRPLPQAGFSQNFCSCPEF